jgi:hypothetical protein
MTDLYNMSKMDLIELVQNLNNEIDTLTDKLSIVYTYYNITEQDLENCLKEDI